MDLLLIEIIIFFMWLIVLSVLEIRLMGKMYKIQINLNKTKSTLYKLKHEFSHSENIDIDIEN